MSLVPEDRSSFWPAPFPRSVFDWPSRLFDVPRLLAEEDIKVEEFTEDGQIVVRAELPGIDPERDIDVSIQDGRLTIRAERRREHTDSGRDYRRSELRYGSFSRIVPLPANASESDVQASYRDGILEVRAPMREPKGRSRIPISHEAGESSEARAKPSSARQG